MRRTVGGVPRSFAVRGVDPQAAMHHAFAVLSTWRGGRADETLVYSPRLARSSPLIQLVGGSLRFSDRRVA